MTIEIVPLRGLPEIERGDDLAALLEPVLTGHGAADGDVVAVTQKIVSKAEGRDVPADERDAWIARESVGVVARRGDLVITRTRHGFVCANAGVDASNVRDGFVTLLPLDPDASAERLRVDLTARLGAARLGVVITDTFGRPWREGLVDVAIGCAGLAPLVDLRGTPDDRGRRLDVTVVALADAVAAASGLVMTKTARVPAAIVRGAMDPAGDAPPGPARALVRAAEDDLFRMSAIEAAAGGPSGGRFGAEPARAEAVERAVEAVSRSAGGDVVFVALTSPQAADRLRALIEPVPPVRTATAFVVVGALPGAGAAGRRRALAAIGALAVALRAQDLRYWWDAEQPHDPARVGAALDLDPAIPVGVVAVGTAGAGRDDPAPSGR